MSALDTDGRICPALDPTSPLPLEKEAAAISPASRVTSSIGFASSRFALGAAAASGTDLTSTPGWTTISVEGGPEKEVEDGP